jgi:hypothetical protein
MHEEDRNFGSTPAAGNIRVRREAPIRWSRHAGRISQPNRTSRESGSEPCLAGLGHRTT